MKFGKEMKDIYLVGEFLGASEILLKKKLEILSKVKSNKLFFNDFLSDEDRELFSMIEAKVLKILDVFNK